MNDAASRPSAQPSAAVPAAPFYRAFLSYSHRDAKLADWLHGALERYRLPRGLVGRVTGAGPVPARLTPIFRDRSELAASDDLSAEICGALAASRCLIVLCSPAAAESRWTNQEIATFKRLHPEARILAAIAAGEPFASETPGREAEECFPHALRHRLGADGRPTGERAEPIAADFREGGDGRRMGLLKLVAGMLGVGLDELARREAQRRQKRLAWLAAASLGGMVVTSGLAVAAIEARNEARTQRAEAEGLIGFMLGDLRAKLEPVGRLEPLDSVGTRALAYYQRQDKSDLSDAALLQRARALTLIGEIANREGHLDSALARYREALATTAEIVARKPDDQQAIFDHAQNVFWVGYIGWQRGQAAEAEQRFMQYRRLADRLLALDPDRPEWRLERIYADTNLGVLLLDRREAGRAGTVFESALRDAERLVAFNPGNRAYQDMLAETLAYVGDAKRDAAEFQKAAAVRERQLALLTRLLIANKDDTEIKRKIVSAQTALGHLMAVSGNAGDALEHFFQASALARELQAIEPGNTEWLELLTGVQADTGHLFLALGRVGDAEAAIRQSCATTQRLLERDSSVVEWKYRHLGECLRLRAEAATAKKRPHEALILARKAVALETEGRQAGQAKSEARSGTARMLLGDIEWTLGNKAAAQAAWMSALTALTSQTTAGAEFQRFALLKRLGRAREAIVVARRLDRAGYRHPAYVRMKGSG